eukprot:13622909-Heterocapsa_arctica.AAC.1
MGAPSGPQHWACVGSNRALDEGFSHELGGEGPQQRRRATRGATRSSASSANLGGMGPPCVDHHGFPRQPRCLGEGQIT